MYMLTYVLCITLASITVRLARAQGVSVNPISSSVPVIGGSSFSHHGWEFWLVIGAVIVVFIVLAAFTWRGFIYFQRRRRKLLNTEIQARAAAFLAAEAEGGKSLKSSVVPGAKIHPWQTNGKGQWSLDSFTAADEKEFNKRVGIGKPAKWDLERQHSL